MTETESQTAEQEKSVPLTATPPPVQTTKALPAAQSLASHSIEGLSDYLGGKRRTDSLSNTLTSSPVTLADDPIPTVRRKIVPSRRRRADNVPSLAAPDPRKPLDTFNESNKVPKENRKSR